MNKEKGRFHFKTSMLNIFRISLFLLVIFFFHDVYLETYRDHRFLSEGRFSFDDVILFLYRYPYELIVFLILVMIPYFYYAFIRGVKFYEMGISYNKGLPWFNIYIPFEKIKKYQLLHPQHLLAITLEDGEIYLIGDNDLSRVISSFDQQGIKGDLAQGEFVKLLQNVKKYFFFVLFFTINLYLAKKFGWFKGH